MASCPSCGAETRQGDWTCRACGGPLGSPPPETTPYGEPAHDRAYYQAPTIYGTAAPSFAQPASRVVPRSSRLSWLVPLVLVAAVAVAAAWFFVLRPAPGAQFVGTWHSTTVSAAGAATETLTITRHGGVYTLSGDLDGGGAARRSASLTGGRLETVYAAPAAQALQFKTFHLVLTVEGGTLTMALRATTVSGASVPVGDTVTFTKAD